MKAYTQKERTEILVDSETGEVLDHNTEVRKKVILANSEKEFYMTYLAIEDHARQLDGACYKVLTYCLCRCNHNTNEVALIKPRLEEMSRTYDIKVQTIRNTIGKLCKMEILTKLGAGLYRIHPRYFWKGDSNSRKATFEVIYNPDNEGL